MHAYGCTDTSHIHMRKQGINHVGLNFREALSESICALFLIITQNFSITLMQKRKKVHLSQNEGKTITAISNHLCFILFYFWFFFPPLRRCPAISLHILALWLIEPADPSCDKKTFFFLFAPGNHASVCTMGAPDLKGNGSRPYDWLLHLQPNTYPWPDEVIVNSW